MPTVSVRTQAHGASIVIEDEGVESGKRAIGRQKRKVITVVIGDELKYHGREYTRRVAPRATEPPSRRSGYRAAVPRVHGVVYPHRSVCAEHGKELVACQRRGTNAAQVLVGHSADAVPHWVNLDSMVTQLSRRNACASFGYNNQYRSAKPASATETSTNTHKPDSTSPSIDRHHGCRGGRPCAQLICRKELR